MAVRNPQRGKPGQSSMEMVVGVLDGSVHPLDLDVRELDPPPQASTFPVLVAFGE